MTDTPDRPGERGRHEDEPTLKHGPFPGAAPAPEGAADADTSAERPPSAAPREDRQVDDPRRDPDTVTIARPVSGLGPPPGSAGSNGSPAASGPDGGPAAAGPGRSGVGRWRCGRVGWSGGVGDEWGAWLRGAGV